MLSTAPCSVCDIIAGDMILIGVCRWMRALQGKAVNIEVEE